MLHILEELAGNRSRLFRALFTVRWHVELVVELVVERVEACEIFLQRPPEFSEGACNPLRSFAAAAP